MARRKNIATDGRSALVADQPALGTQGQEEYWKRAKEADEQFQAKMVEVLKAEKAHSEEQ